ncbi:MAG: hypothetical protein LUI05_05635 [Oscillospiraceae bacterium]|nr:hypothetical protein [Oscillospiraceae bacterium]
MSLFKRKSPFARSAAVLSEEGFSDNYIETLKNDIEPLKKNKDISKGQSYLINALIIRGRLSDACGIYTQCENDGIFSKLDKELYPNLLQNVMFAYFIRDKFKDSERIYKEYNHIVLADSSDSMKRSLAIHECINERYENAVTILAKIMDSDCRFLDLCLVKTVLKLDMYDRAAELSADFDSYKGRGELEQAAQKLRKKIFEGASAAKKVKMIKKK